MNIFSPNALQRRGSHPSLPGVDITWDELLKVKFYPPGYSPQTGESHVTQDGPIRYTALSASITKW